MIPKSELDKFARKVIRKYPTINCGGCCVFAALFGKRLQNFYPVRIVIFGYRYNKSVDHVRKNAASNTPRAWDRAGIDLNHVVIEYTDENGNIWHYDATGVHKADGSIYRNSRVPGYATIKEAIELSSVPEGWNHTFNRAVIPELDDMIQKFFYRYKAPIRPFQDTWKSRFYQWWSEVKVTLIRLNNFSFLNG